jgi:hypothetical protein
VPSAELAGVPTQTGQQLVILNLVVVLPQMQTVPILPWVITQAHLTITVWVFAGAGVQPLHPQAHHLSVAKLLPN